MLILYVKEEYLNVLRVLGVSNFQHTLLQILLPVFHLCRVRMTMIVR